MVTLRKGFNFWPSVVFIGVVLAFFWGRGVLKVILHPETYQRVPSSYDTDIATPVQARVNGVKTPLILMEFYQDPCLNCRALAPVLHEWNQTPQANSCFTLIPVNVEKPENRFYMDIFQVNQVPALFIFQPQQMKKTAVPLKGEVARVPNAIQTTLSLHLSETHQPLPKECQL
jgi:thiol:disulfide interchange protein